MCLLIWGMSRNLDMALEASLDGLAEVGHDSDLELPPVVSLVLWPCWHWHRGIRSTLPELT